MTRVSNDTGRAFEYAIAKKLAKYLESKKILFSFTTRAQKDNQRDKQYFEQLNEELKQDFSKAGDAAIKWMISQNWFVNIKKINIDRMPDITGVNASVVDIQLQIYNDKGLIFRNISLKNHHNALKHPRLPNLPFQCGINNPKISKLWREINTNIWKQFYLEARKLDNTTNLFRELKVIDNKFIEQNLYKPLILAVINFLNQYANNPDSASKYFKFLRGDKSNFFTIKNESNQILIKKFVEFKLPTQFKIKYPYNTLTTFMMEFDNGWRFTLRLHTASSEFFRNGKINESTKLDVLCENLDKVIEIDKVKK